MFAEQVSRESASDLGLKLWVRISKDLGQHEMAVIQQPRDHFKVWKSPGHGAAVIPSYGPGNQVAAAGFRCEIMKAMIQIKHLQVRRKQVPDPPRRGR